MGAAAIIGLITALLPVVTNNIPSLSTGIKQIINDIMGAVSAVSASGALQTQNPSTILLALSGVIAALKAEPNIPGPVLDLIGALDRAAQAALVADKQAQVVVDPTQLQPIAPLP